MAHTLCSRVTAMWHTRCAPCFYSQLDPIWKDCFALSLLNSMVVLFVCLFVSLFSQSQDHLSSFSVLCHLSHFQTQGKWASSVLHYSSWMGMVKTSLTFRLNRAERTAVGSCSLSLVVCPVLYHHVVNSCISSALFMIRELMLQHQIPTALVLSTRSATLSQREIRWLWYDLLLTIKADYYLHAFSRGYSA